MKLIEIREGDLLAGELVRVKRPDDFITSLASKVRDRDATVLDGWRWERRNGVYDKHQTVRVRFHKRNGRGKEFEMTFPAYDLVRAGVAA